MKLIMYILREIKKTGDQLFRYRLIISKFILT